MFFICEPLAPAGCLQYFTGTSGTIESFNIDGGVHLSNQYYTICIRTEKGYCDIVYAKTTFSISSGNKVEGDDCTEDYIIIPDNGKNNNRYCGMALSDINSKLEVILQLRKHHFDLSFSLSTTL